MRRIFISYGSGLYRGSLKRICKEARNTRLFDKVIAYSDKDMPSFIKSSPLKAYQRGDGYWQWKPYIIWKTMMDYPDSLVIYADSGCIVNNNIDEWNYWFSLAERYDTIVFQYREDFHYSWTWEKEENCSYNYEYCKKSLVSFFEPLIGQDWLAEQQVFAGLVLACRRSSLIKMWLDIALLHPELLVDCYGPELIGQDARFVEHRHDQSILTVSAVYWRNSSEHVVKFLPETAESEKTTAAVIAARIHNPIKIPRKKRVIQKLRKILGDSTYEVLRSKYECNKFIRTILLLLEYHK